MLKGGDMVVTDNMDEEDRQDEEIAGIDATNIEIRVHGVNVTASNEFKEKLEKVTVEQHAQLPDRFMIRIEDKSGDDGKFTIMDTDQFKVGEEVEISTKGESLIKGEITGVQPIFSPEGTASLVVNGYTKDHRLYRGTKTRTYGDANPTGAGITLENVVNTIVQETDGLTGKDVDTSELSAIKFSYLIQWNQSDMGFLRHLARHIGYVCYVDDKKLCFKKPAPSSGAVELTWKENLRSFQARMNLSEQVDKAVAKGWDPETKQLVEGTFNTASDGLYPEIGLVKTGDALAKECFGGGAELILSDPTIWTVDEAKGVARGLWREMSGRFMEAEGVAYDTPKIKAGKWVDIKQIGERYSGKYFVSSAVHDFTYKGLKTTFRTGRMNADLDMQGLIPESTDFQVSAAYYRLDRSLDAISLQHVFPPYPSLQPPPRCHGVVPAKVTSLEDPEELGRVQVMFPFLPKYKDADLSSNWARIAGVGGGSERGLFVLPEIDDEVLVAFENGDFNRPYILGGLWNNTDKPPFEETTLSSDKKKVDLRTWKSRSGHRITLDDKEGEEKLVIISKNEHRITIDDKENVVKIGTAKGVMASLSDVGKIELNTKKATIILDETQNKITIESPGDILVAAAGNLDLNSKGNLNLKAQGNLNIEGAATNIKAMSAMNLAANALVEIKGALIKLN
jgi:phage baseplate assembly protein gpV